MDECLFPFFVCVVEKCGPCYMDAWNNVLDGHCDVNVLCMDGTLFLIMYVCCHGGAMCWIHHMSAVHVKKIYVYLCVNSCEIKWIHIKTGDM